jgi:hypothetical protein
MVVSIRPHFLVVIAALPCGGWGPGTGKKQIMDIRCQRSPIYHGAKVDKDTGTISGYSDYRDSTYCNDCKNQRHGQKGKMLLTELSLNGVSQAQVVGVKVMTPFESI